MDLLARMTHEVEAVGGFVHRVASFEEARAAVLRILEERGAERIVYPPSSRIDRLDLASRYPIEDDIFAADAGVTPADWGVADTGTLALLAGPDNERTLSLVPPLHIAVLDGADLVADVGVLFEKLGERGELPSALTLITGPSRTGDIELTLTVGVHGPGELHVVLVGSSPP